MDVVMLWALLILAARQSDPGAGTHEDALVPLLEAFVIHQALFVQLEISTGISPTPHLLTSQSSFPGLGIAPCSQGEPVKAIDFLST